MTLTRLSPPAYAVTITLLLPFTAALLVLFAVGIILLLPFAPFVAYRERREELARFAGEPGKN